MGLIQVNATFSGTKENPVNTIQATYGVEDGNNLEGAIELYGADVVFGQFQKGIKTSARNALRGQLSSGRSTEEALSRMDGWRPGVALESSIDPKRALIAQMGSMTKEEKIALINEIKAVADAK